MFDFMKESFNATEWAQLVMIEDEFDANTRMLLCEFSNHLDSQGRSTTKPKLLSRTLGFAESDVRKHLGIAKRAGWLEPVTIDGRKGYQAVMP